MYRLRMITGTAIFAAALLVSTVTVGAAVAPAMPAPALLA